VSDILLVDDEEAVCWALQRALSGQGHTVAVVSSAEEALTHAADLPPDAVLLDVRLPAMDGLTALPKLRRLAPEAAVIIMTAHGTLSTAVRAVEGGAFDYLAKPFDLQQALDTVARALQRQPAASRTSEMPPPVAGELIGRGPAMQAVFKHIALVAPRDAAVLITGESGTGKELVARAVHRHSRYRDRPFVPVHVAALNPNLVESELFGHVKGAFTGAGQARQGLLALANGGTVFLDEVADIPLPVQAKLLRVLEYGEVLPVGGTVAQPIKVRVLSATHRDLPQLIASGEFRHDLFFRLNVYQIHLAPLRERTDDIPLLAEHILRHCEPAAQPLGDDTLRYLAAQAWPGNVRELRNALEHAAIVARGGPLRPEHFPQPGPSPAADDAVTRLAAAVRDWLARRLADGSKPPGNLYDELLACVEPALLDEVMRRVHDNRWATAQWLGLNRATVRKKMARYRPGSAATDEGEADHT
jgi:two-component system nitrogen regulation response regulator GlnG